MTRPITLRQFHQADGVQDWRVLAEGACTYFRPGSFAAGARLVRRSASWPAWTTTTPASTCATTARPCG
jgi:hypothetical protein